MNNQNHENFILGQKVRSFDFDGRDLEGERACYVEGTVSYTDKKGVYAIAVNKTVFGGEVKPTPAGKIVYAPLNGTPTIGGFTNGVELI